MQGRLMGKRFQAEFFLESAHAETHGCNYLLATDLEMETVPGFAATSWAAGYGDYVMKPDLATLRRIPWLDGTALVLCDVLDHHGHGEVPHSPRAMLKRQIARLRELGLRRWPPRSWSSSSSPTPTPSCMRRAIAASPRPARTTRTITSSRPPRRRR